jgi:hypothetical protein
MPGGAESGPDRAVLNRATIRGFVESAVRAHGGEIERETNGRWTVALPDPLAEEFDRERATFVFDPAHRSPDEKAMLVAPGTRAFTVFCALAARGPPPGATSDDDGSDAENPDTGITESTAQGEKSPDSAVTGSVVLDGSMWQLHTPPVLAAAGFETTVEEYTPRGRERAIAFHFQAQFLSVRSYQREEFHTTVVDPATRSVLPGFATRLQAHLPHLLDTDTRESERTDTSEQHGGVERAVDRRADGGAIERSTFDRTAVEGAYSAAKTAAIEELGPTADALREVEDEALTERIEEIETYYEGRRADLNARVEDQRETVEDLSEKYDRAQSDDTRLGYLRERREAESDLDALTEDVDDRIEALDQEEHERIDAAVERHRIDINLDLVGVTDLTYDRGVLALSMTDGRTSASPQVSYVPATDDHYGLDCACCGTDLVGMDSTAGDTTAVPKLCVGGHLVCEACGRTCRTCGETRCEGCLGEANTDITDSERSVTGGNGRTAPFGSCWLCREPVCEACESDCVLCGESVCAEHATICETGGETVCLACGEPCKVCETIHCDAHLRAVGGAEDRPPAPTGESEPRTHTAGALYCERHVASCAVCGERRSTDGIAHCENCDRLLCEAHRSSCGVCGTTCCPEHAHACEHCTVPAERFCEEHTERCLGGGEVVCEEHGAAAVLATGRICVDHRVPCALCGVAYAEAGLDEGRCSACRDLNTDEAIEPPVATVAETFPSARVGTTPTHAVIHGKRRLRRDELVVIDRATGEELRREKLEFFAGLGGGP